MHIRAIVSALMIAGSVAAVAVRAQEGAQGTCPRDAKLLNGGPTLVYGEGPGTWWGLTTAGLDAAGLATDEQKIEYLNQAFGTSFDNLDALAAHTQDLVSSNWDLNANGFVCAYELRGTRAYLGDPLINLTAFAINDDRLPKTR